MAAPTSVKEFLALVLHSDLLDQAQFRSYLERLSASGGIPKSPDLMSEALVRDEFLTYYQAEQILAGRYKSFFLGGKYKVLERLGAGGMATVFLCEHRVMKRLVALKVLPGVGADDPDTLARFHREARAVAQLSHPNIVGAYDLDRHGKLHFLVMEYVDGCNLEQAVAAVGPLEPARAAAYISQASMGLQHAYEAGVVHRDVKPANLLIDRAGTVKLLDLGLARLARDESEGLTKRADVQFLLGTVDFLAPEQALDSHEVDIRADVYSLGATFYYLLTGRTPFEGIGTMQKLAAHQHRRPDPLRELRPDVPEGLASVVERMMEKEPSRRYQEPIAVAEALAPWFGSPLPPLPLVEQGALRLSPAARSTILKQMAMRTPTPKRSVIQSTVVAAPSPVPAPVVAAPAPSRGRRVALFGAAAVLLIAGITGGAWWFVSGHSRGRGDQGASRPPAVAVAIANRAQVRSEPGTPSAAPATAAARDITEGLIHRYTFDEEDGETAKDSVGEAHGALSNRPSRVRGRVGAHALAFNGVDQSVVVPDSPDLRFARGQGFTLSAWVRLDESSFKNQWTFVVIKGQGSDEGRYGLGLAPFDLWCSFGSANYLGTSKPKVGWQMVSVVQDVSAGTRTLFLDGSPTTTGPALASDAPGSFTIGRSLGEWSDFFSGAVDDVRIYNRALGPDEVAALHRAAD